MKVRLIKTARGYGEEGDIFDVSHERAERWARVGLAEIIDDFVKKDTDLIEPPKPKKRGRKKKQ